jgi:glutamate/tyrosine decarboxylase-like PLP-dependent enzyme
LASAVDPNRLDEAWRDFARRMDGNYPFFHPRYAGQMLKPPHPVAVAGYLAAMLVNPNNHALDASPVTSEMEKEVVERLAGMFRLPPGALGHLSASGTIANLEALWVARELHPDRAIAFSDQSHYTHERMCRLLAVPGEKLPSDAPGRLDLDALASALESGWIGTVVVNAGTTGRGIVDPIDEALALCRRHGVRVHVDAAYGGFFALLAHEDDSPVPAGAYRAIAQCDSVVVDPHKHGLQPFGCGAVLFADPSVARLYRHESPYTYFSSDDLHLGEISLECSRSGAAAAALWLTLEAVPLTEDGLGAQLTACLRAAREWARLISASSSLTLFEPPELDILTFFPTPAEDTLAAVDRATQKLYNIAAADSEDPVWLSVLAVDRRHWRALHPLLGGTEEQARVLRSVLMKPEHEPYVPHLHDRLTGLASGRSDDQFSASPT